MAKGEWIREGNIMDFYGSSQPEVLRDVAEYIMERNKKSTAISAVSVTLGYKDEVSNHCAVLSYYDYEEKK